MSGLTRNQLDIVFPYHIKVDREFKIIQVGSKLDSFISKKDGNISRLLGEHVGDLFDLTSPHISRDWNKLFSSKNATYDMNFKHTQYYTRRNMKSLLLRGGILISDPLQDSEVESYHVIFLVSPRVTSSTDLVECSMTFSDLSKYTLHRECMLMGK